MSGESSCSFALERKVRDIQWLGLVLAAYVPGIDKCGDDVGIVRVHIGP